MVEDRIQVGRLLTAAEAEEQRRRESTARLVSARFDYGPFGTSIYQGGTIGTQTSSPPPKKPRGPQNVLRDLPDDPGDRKNTPIGTGVLDYFPAALAEIARLSKAGNDQHNPGEPLNWARGKSNDHWDCITRHGIQRGTRDSDGMRHSAKLAWRALALLQEEIEADAGWAPEE